MSLIAIHEQRKAMVNVLVEESAKSRQCPLCMQDVESLVQACEMDEESNKGKKEFSPHYVCRTCFSDGKHAKTLTKCLLCSNFQQTMDRYERGSFFKGMPCRKVYNNTPYNELAAQVNSLCKAEEELRTEEYRLLHSEAEATRKAAAQATREKRASQESQEQESQEQESQEMEVIEVDDGAGEGGAAGEEAGGEAGGEVLSPEYAAAHREQEARRDAEIERVDRMAALAVRAEHESAVEARQEAQERRRKRKEAKEAAKAAGKGSRRRPLG